MELECSTRETDVTPECSLMGSKIRFATPSEGRALIAARDAFTTRLAAHELQARAQASAEVTLEDYLRRCESHVRAWSAAEVERHRGIIREVEGRAKDLGIRLALPEEVLLVKTTGQEEGGANGYTRGTNIFLKEGAGSTKLFVHELFHVFSRRNPAVATRAYELLGFREIPDVPHDDPMRLTNPDSMGLRHAIQVRHKGKDRDVCMVLRGRWPYRGGRFFRYIEKRLLALEKRDDRYVPELSDGNPVLLRFEDVEGLFEKIGRNTTYNFHPEEISAVHFELLFTEHGKLPDPHLVDGLRKLLTVEKT
jgi:hypothetical protein